MFRWLGVLFGFTFVVLSSAGPVHAAGDKPPSAFEGALDLTIWTWVVFLLLFLILKKYAWGPIMEGLQKREENIHRAIDDARKAREESEQLRAQFQADVSKAHAQVAELLDEARRDAQHTKEEMITQARQEIQDERDRLRREIEMTRDQALQELWNRAAELATVVSSKAVRRQLSQEDHRRLVDEALADLNKAGSDWQKQAGGLRV